MTKVTILNYIITRLRGVLIIMAAETAKAVFVKILMTEMP